MNLKTRKFKISFCKNRKIIYTLNIKNGDETVKKNLHVTNRCKFHNFNNTFNDFALTIPLYE